MLLLQETRCIKDEMRLNACPFRFRNILSRGVAQPGSARRSGRRGREFESHHPDHFHLITPTKGFPFSSAQANEHQRQEIRKNPTHPRSPMRVLAHQEQ